MVRKANELAARPLAFDLDAWLSEHFDPTALAVCNGAQLEEKFIAPLLTRLGWSRVYQAGLTVQGKFAKPDCCLLLQPEQENTLIAGCDHTLVTAVCESKAWGKAGRDKNPHHQLQDYLGTLRARFGFLTNGRLWRMYDTDKITAKKTFIEFDLERVCALPDAEEKRGALVLLAFFFDRDTYAPPPEAGVSSAIEQTIAASADFTLAVEKNLKAVIYGYAGEDSLFEIMGRAIHQANPQASRRWSMKTAWCCCSGCCSLCIWRIRTRRF